MALHPDARALNLPAVAPQGLSLSGQTEVGELGRLLQELEASAAAPIAWQAHLQWRQAAGASAQLWLHLQAQARLPLGCQRCLAPVLEAIEIDRWFRFVESEEVALAEDDDCEEDLLVMQPQFDLLNLLEDELLLDLPLVPMHKRCPDSVPELDQPEVAKPNPFAVLAGLKNKAP
ncbi:MAG: hypothetical protein RLZZ180_826 [Pseudomonadota bacterium]|jgi:uncharacterized protein